MKPDIEGAQEYREEAAKVRNLALSKTDPRTRNALLSIAYYYETVANSLDAIARSKQALGNDFPSN
jgi:hypothetical protein